jgi:hypothetical protein
MLGGVLRIKEVFCGLEERNDNARTFETF